MSTPPKSIRRIFDYSQNKPVNATGSSPQTPKRRPIFSEERKSTIRKNNISPSFKTNHTDSKCDTIAFLQKMLLRVQSKSKLLQQLESQNQSLKKDNYHIQSQNQQVLKKIAVFSGVEKLKQRNSQYRAKLLKAQALLYQLRRTLKNPIRGLDDLISSLQI